MPTILGIVGISVAASVGALVGARIFLFESRYIPSGSMEPTLRKEDRVIVNKWVYYSQSPQRGDVVVFQPTQTLQQQNFHDAFIKRIVGLPGETVMVKQGKVFINNQPLPEPYIAEPPQYQWGPVTVPLNQYVVFGDNRNNAYDSHYWGFVPRDRIIGRAVVRFWPPQRVGSLGEQPKE